MGTIQGMTRRNVAVIQALLATGLLEVGQPVVFDVNRAYPHPRVASHRAARAAWADLARRFGLLQLAPGEIQIDEFFWTQYSNYLAFVAGQKGGTQ